MEENREEHNREHQDWQTVTLKGKNVKPKIPPTKTQVRRPAATNPNSNPLTSQSSTRKLEEETEIVKHEHVPRSISQQLVAARVASKLSQRELATRLNIQVSTLASIENGQAIYNTPTKLIINRIKNSLHVTF